MKQLLHLPEVKASPAALSRAMLYGLMALHVGCASATYVFGKAAAVGFGDPAVLTLLRASGAAVIFLLLTGTVIPLPRFSLREWGYLCWLGFLVVPANQYCFLRGLQYTVPSHPALLYALTPLAVLLLDSLRLKSMPPPAKLIGVCLALAGAAIILRPWERGCRIQPHSDRRSVDLGRRAQLGILHDCRAGVLPDTRSPRRNRLEPNHRGPDDAAPRRTKSDRAARGGDTGSGLVFAGLAGGHHQCGHDAAMERHAARSGSGGSSDLHQRATARHRVADRAFGRTGLVGPPAGSGAVFLFRDGAGDCGSGISPIQTRLKRASPEAASFGPARRSHVSAILGAAPATQRYRSYGFAVRCKNAAALVLTKI